LSLFLMQGKGNLPLTLTALWKDWISVWIAKDG
jgi:hypothetical protein